MAACFGLLVSLVLARPRADNPILFRGSVLSSSVMARSKEKTPSFERAIEQLEAITDQIESGQIGLEESLKQYEQGMKLIKQCRSILDAAEKRIAHLGADGAGGLSGDQKSK